MTCIDRPVLRALVRTNGREGAVRIINGCKASVARSGGVMGLLYPYGQGPGHELKASDRRMTGVIAYQGTSVAQWTDGVLKIWRKRIQQVPLTALQAIVGRPVTDLIDWDVLDAGMIVTGIHEDGINHRIDLRNTTIPLDEVADRVAKGEFD